MVGDKIVFNKKQILEMIDKGGTFLLDPKAEDFLKRWIDFKKFIEELDNDIKDTLRSEMNSRNTVKVEGDGVKVIKRYFGSKYGISDTRLAMDQGFARESTRYTVETKAVDEFVDEHGELPDGISLNDRKETIVISEITDEKKLEA